MTMTMQKLTYGNKTKLSFITPFIIMGIVTIFAILPYGKAFSAEPADKIGFKPTETYELIRSKEVVCIDVRTPMEYRSGHAEGCKLLPIADPSFADNVAALDPDKTYVFICRTQNRSKNAAMIARQNGLSSSYISYGGIRAWRQSGLPLIKYK